MSATGDPGAARASNFEQCIARGGVVLFPSDTVYGLACDPQDPAAIQRLYDLKRRPPAKSSAVMFFDLDAALSVLEPLDLGGRTQAALRSLMPGGLTVLLANPERLFPLACAADPDTLGVRVVSVPELAGVQVPVMQSSANLAGGAEARRLEDVPQILRDGADLVIDGGELPGVASTVVDLREYEQGGFWAVVRPGAVDEERLRQVLQPHFHFVAPVYGEVIRQDVPGFDELEDQVAEATGGVRAQRILELGTGTGETAQRVLERHPGASLVGIDESGAMLEQARERLSGAELDLRVGRLQDPLPDGPFDLVVSALCVHHLDPAEKANLFRRVHGVLAPGGRLVLGDVVIPGDPADQVCGMTPGYDKPDSAADQLVWLQQAGFTARLIWERRDLAVIVGDLPDG